MSITIVQAILITLVTILLAYDGMNLQWFLFGSTTVIGGFLTGLILGDFKTGLAVGATMQLMSLGIGAYGGASVPDYLTGAIIGTAFAISSGKGVNAGLALSVPVALLVMEFDILYRIINTYFLHRAMKAADKLDEKKMYRNILYGIIPLTLSKGLPVLICLTVGKNAINELLTILPKWVTGGMSVAGGLLPAVGIAILLRYMSTKENIAFLILGFVLMAYLKVPMLGITLIGLVVAISAYKINNRFDEMKTQTVSSTSQSGDEGDEGYED